MVEITEDLIGKRVLWRTWQGRYFNIIHEGEIKEISPSGKYIKIDDEWKAINSIEILEVL